MRRVFFALLLSCASAGVVKAQLATYQGPASQTTPPFTTTDSWEVHWMSIRGLNVTVYGSNDAIVAGANSSRGALYIPKGGTYHLQIDSAGLPPGMVIPPNQGPGAMQNKFSGGGNNPPSMPPNHFPTMMTQYEVEIIQLDQVTAPGTMGTTGMPGFLPNYALPGTAAATQAMQWGSQPTSTPTPTTSPATSALSADQSKALVFITGDKAVGTGFLVKTFDGPMVITSIHLIANNPNLKITTNNGAILTVLSMRGASDRDLAEIAIKDFGYSFLNVSTDISRTVQTGDEVVTVGSNMSSGAMLNTEGRVVEVGPVRIDIDNPISRGSIGGPVFHPKTGKVLGVVTQSEDLNLPDDLEKSPFVSRNSAINGEPHYYALRMDTVDQWIPIDPQRFQIETQFLDDFHQQSRRLDAYLNPQTGPGGINVGGRDSKIYLDDDAIMKANSGYLQDAAGTDTEGHIDALRALLFSLQSIAGTDVDKLQDQGNFYSFDKGRAQDELNYRQALLKELDSIGSDIQRLGSLPRSNSTSTDTGNPNNN